MRLGVNSVLWGDHELPMAFAGAARAGFDGIELSAIPSMSDHLNLDQWQREVGVVQELAENYSLQLLAVEQPSQNGEVMDKCFRLCQALGISVVNCGPGGRSGDSDSLKASIRSLTELSKRAEDYGVVLCVKAHVGAAIYNTETSLKALEEISSPAFRLDFDCSHIHRAGEDVLAAVEEVIPRVGHIHIRDCRGREGPPGPPEMQVNGRGDIDMVGFIAVLHRYGYAGPVDLEIIGAKDYDLVSCQAIASEARGHMQACLQACGAR